MIAGAAYNVYDHWQRILNGILKDKYKYVPTSGSKLKQNNNYISQNDTKRNVHSHSKRIIEYTSI